MEEREEGQSGSPAMASMGYMMNTKANVSETPFFPFVTAGALTHACQK